MTEVKRPLKVFLCHAHADRDAVKALYARLTKDGVDAWLDKEKLLPGQDWELEIRKAVREADVVVVCLSKQFNQAGFRQKEVRLALDTAMEKPEGEIFIIPARLEECNTLESLRKWHWVDLFEENGYEMLVRALKTRADKVGVALQAGNDPAYEFRKPEPNRGKTPKPLNLSRAAVLVGLAVIVVAGMLSPSLIRRWFSPKSEPTVTSDLLTAPGASSAVTAAPTVRPSATASPLEITDAKDVKMVLVPAGEFSMGSNQLDNEKPIHAVSLSAYYIDKYEVTNAAYQRCVDAGACNPPKQSSSYTRTAYYGNPEFDEYPVIYVDWNMAKTYCEWRSDRLPTEAEWEKAARGTDGRIYPWGEGISCDKANYTKCKGDTTKVGSYLKGVSPYGVYDMAGNVWEWVNDWYDSSYYQNSPATNPLGPDSGQYRVLRGGSWLNVDGNVRSADRVYYSPVFYFIVGFRCAKDANP